MSDSDNPLEGIPCRECRSASLRIEYRETLVAKPIGTYSLAGAQPKAAVVERPWPWAVCDSCGAESRGKPA